MRNLRNEKIIFYANLLLFSLIFSFHILIRSQEPANNGKNILLYLSSVPFAVWFIGLSASLFLALLLLPGAGAKGGPLAKEKEMLLILILLLVLSVVLPFFRHIDRGWNALFNGVFSLALGVLYFRLKVFKEIEAKPGAKWPFYMLCVAAFLFIVLAAASGFSGHNAFSTFSKDMGIFTNLVWRIAEDGSQFTMLEDLSDHRGVHFQPVLYLLALIFRIKCSPYILIFLQAFFSLGASVFLYMLSARLLKNTGAAFFIALAFLTSTYTARTFIYDYHPESMYMMMFFAFMYFALCGKFPAAAVFMCLAAGVKEEAAVYAALASLYVFTENRDKRYLALSICAAVYAAVAIFIVMPAYGPGTGSWVGATLKNSVNLLNPGLAAGLLMQFFIFLLGAAFIPVFSLKPLLLIFLPPVLVHFANYRDSSHLLFNMWYASFVTPALFTAAVYALNKRALNNKIFSKQIVFIAFVIFILQSQLHLAFMSEFSAVYSAAVCVIIAGLVILPLTKFIRGKKAVYPVFVLVSLAVFYFGYCDFHKTRMGDVPKEGKESIKKAMRFIPASRDAAVMTNSNIVPHLCCRKYIWTMDTGKTNDAFMPVLRGNMDRFYMFVYLYDFTYASNGIEPTARIREITAQALKHGFSYGFLYNDNITGVIEFARQ